jgi:ATP-dependent DNA helicase RecQ
MEEIRKTYQAVANYFQMPIGSGEGSTFDFDLNDFSEKYKLNHLTAFNSLKFLEKEGFLILSDAFFHPSRVHFSINKEELYKFQVEHIAFDPFIKLLLRSHAGIFDTYAKISEQDLAKRSGMTYEEVKRQLTELQKMDVLTYIQQTEMPQLTFLSPRIDAKNIIISKENLQKRKERAQERMDAMVYYIENKTKCRSQILLSYFGETDSYRCGICDICLERNKLELSNLEFETVTEQVKNILAKEPLALKPLVDSVKNSKEDKVIKVIQWLIDSEKLVYDDDNRLKWKK